MKSNRRPSGPPTEAVEALKAGGDVSDRHFDLVYPPSLRELSREHWTPVRVACRAARLLVDANATSILDVGSGPGKFCIIGALTTSAAYAGVERRRFLVDAARAAAARYGVRGVRFSQGNVVDFDFEGFDGFYLFNPFFEQVGRKVPPIDAEVGHSRRLYRHYVAATERKLAAAPPGTAVVTYHGFGGIMPLHYQQVHEERAGGSELVLWKKL